MVKYSYEYRRDESLLSLIKEIKKRKKLKQIKRIHKKFIEARKKSEEEINDLYVYFREQDQYPLNEVDTYKKIKEHIKSTEKAVNYTGARLLLITMLTSGILSPVIFSVFFKEDSEGALFNVFKSNMSDFISNSSNVFMNILYGFILVSTILIMFLVIFLGVHYLIQNYDKYFRNSIYNLSIMNDVLDEIIEKLEKK